MYRTDFWTLWEKARVGWSERTASKHVYYQVWNRSPVQVGCMRQVLRAGALEWPRGMGWGGRWEGVSGWGTHVNPRLIHVSVWQKPPQYCKVISLQLIKIIGKKIIKRSPEKIYFCFIDYVKAFDCVDHNKLWKIFQEMAISDHLTYLLRNLYSG